MRSALPIALTIAALGATSYAAAAAQASNVRTSGSFGTTGNAYAYHASLNGVRATVHATYTGDGKTIVRFHVKGAAESVAVAA